MSGNASYSIYLVHLPAMNAIALVVAGLGVADSVPPTVMLLFLIVVGVGTGAVMHVVLEKPLLAQLSSRRDGRRAASSEVAAVRPEGQL